jgi:hypothetical protein
MRSAGLADGSAAKTHGDKQQSIAKSTTIRQNSMVEPPEIYRLFARQLLDALRFILL